jgi:aryl-alcohol dehydrogenase-like predicted oxidoreductase
MEMVMHNRNPLYAPTALDHYRTLGRSGLRVSPLCFGVMTFGKEWGWGADKETSRQLFDRYVELGGNFFDTANIYTKGTSEDYLGEFMQGRRDEFVVGTKYTFSMSPRDAESGKRGDANHAGNHRKNMMRSVEASLKRLRTDYIDLYWVHCFDGITPYEEVMRAFDDLVRQGKVCHIAVSDWPAWRIAQANTWADSHGLSRFVAMQMHYNLCERSVERDIVPYALDDDIAMMPWSPLHSGVLTGKYTRADLERTEPTADEEGTRAKGALNRLDERKMAIVEMVVEIGEKIGKTPAQVALNWLLSRPSVASIIIGARTMEQLDANLDCLDFTLDDEFLKRLEQVSQIDVGFPHDFLAADNVQKMLASGERVEGLRYIEE